MITLKKVVKNTETGQETERVVEFHEIDVKNALGDGWVHLDQEITKEAPVVAPEKNSGRPPFKTKSQKDDAPPESISGV